MEELLTEEYYNTIIVPSIKYQFSRLRPKPSYEHNASFEEHVAAINEIRDQTKNQQIAYDDFATYVQPNADNSGSISIIYLNLFSETVMRRFIDANNIKCEGYLDA